MACKLSTCCLIAVNLLWGCGDRSPNGSTGGPTATHPTQDSASATPGTSQTPARTAAGTSPHGVDHGSLVVGQWRAVGEVQVHLANPAVRFPDKNPGAVRDTSDEAHQRADKIAMALQQADWRFEPDGKANMTWTDPALGKRVELTGTWSDLFNSLNITLNNPVVTYKLSDGSPNAPTTLQITGKWPTPDMPRMYLQGHFFHAPDAQPRSTGGCTVVLERQ
ncbi:MAG: hypothetical protein GC164_12600 [Phycisphaera sp.]|nr:hypothetical protein [Phycisphaera sp.]